MKQDNLANVSALILDTNVSELQLRVQATWPMRVISYFSSDKSVGKRSKIPSPKRLTSSDQGLPFAFQFRIFLLAAFLFRFFSARIALPSSVLTFSLPKIVLENIKSMMRDLRFFRVLA
jgi:hypothetical protein